MNTLLYSLLLYRDLPCLSLTLNFLSFSSWEDSGGGSEYAGPGLRWDTIRHETMQALNMHGAIIGAIWPEPSYNDNVTKITCLVRWLQSRFLPYFYSKNNYIAMVKKMFVIPGFQKNLLYSLQLATSMNQNQQYPGSPVTICPERYSAKAIHHTGNRSTLHCKWLDSFNVTKYIDNILTLGHNYHINNEWFSSIDRINGLFTGFKICIKLRLNCAFDFAAGVKVTLLFNLLKLNHLDFLIYLFPF